MWPRFLRRWSQRRRRLRLIYDEAYRLPFTGTDAAAAVQLRRADEAMRYLVWAKAVAPKDIVGPPSATYEAIGRVHGEAYLDSLQEPATLARIFAADPTDVFVDGLLHTLRLACGGTLSAARYTLETKRPSMNLLGGFHHAAPDRGAGYCALNDVAIAVSELRREGFAGRVAVLDLDFHPPDGTSACLGRDASVWLGSLSGVDWGPLEGVDETVLPKDTGDDAYLAALDALLARMPRVDLAFVLAGGDVLAGDPLGGLALTLKGIRRRDLTVVQRLGSLPQVWLPAGGYTAHAWKVLAGSGLAVALESAEPIPLDFDPVAATFGGIAKQLHNEELGGGGLVITEADLGESLGGRREGPAQLLGFYTAQGLELALERFRILPLLRRLGFIDLRVKLDRPAPYDRARLVGKDSTTGTEVVLIELEVERRHIGLGTFLFVNWLSLRNPRAQFSRLRPQLPGQEVPGLGLAREMTQLLGLMAKRLVLDGVAFRPSWFHMAYAARHGAHFIDSARQGRFEALIRDLREFPLLDATRLVADGKVLLNGKPYAWEADEMVQWIHPRDDEAQRVDAEVARERDRAHFTVATSGASGS